MGRGLRDLLRMAINAFGPPFYSLSVVNVVAKCLMLIRKRNWWETEMTFTGAPQPDLLTQTRKHTGSKRGGGHAYLLVVELCSTVVSLSYSVVCVCDLVPTEGWRPSVQDYLGCCWCFIRRFGPSRHLSILWSACAPKWSDSSDMPWKLCPPLQLCTTMTQNLSCIPAHKLVVLATMLIKCISTHPVDMETENKAAAEQVDSG